MNLKQAKELRKIAMRASASGEPMRQLIMYKQLTTPTVNRAGETYVPTRYCAVNNPNTFRGRYRTLKNGRAIDMRRVEMAMHDIKASARRATEVPSDLYARGGVSQVKPKQSWISKMVDKFNRIFRQQHK